MHKNTHISSNMKFNKQIPANLLTLFSVAEIMEPVFPVRRQLVRNYLQIKTATKLRMDKYSIVCRQLTVLYAVNRSHRVQLLVLLLNQYHHLHFVVF